MLNQILALVPEFRHHLKLPCEIVFEHHYCWLLFSQVIKSVIVHVHRRNKQRADCTKVCDNDTVRKTTGYLLMNKINQPTKSLHLCFEAELSDLKPLYLAEINLVKPREFLSKV